MEIKTDEQYQEAVQSLVERHRARRAPRETLENEQLQQLATAIIEYEKQNYPM